MSTLKRVLRHSPARSVAGRLIARYVKVIRVLGRLNIENAGVLDGLIDQGRPLIVCYWHSRLLLFPYLWRYRTKLNMLVSRHRDGMLISRAGARFGFAPIAGSSSKGGSQAVRAMIRALKAGECVAVTPDGPRGPRMRVSPGVVHTARMAGAPVVPVAFTASKRRVLGSWDRFILPLPFSDFRIRIGEPLEIAPDADDKTVEETRRILEERLNGMTVEIERAWGLDPIEPDPPAERIRPMGAAISR